MRIFKVAPGSLGAPKATPKVARATKVARPELGNKTKLYERVLRLFALGQKQLMLGNRKLIPAGALTVLEHTVPSASTTRESLVVFHSLLKDIPAVPENPEELKRLRGLWQTAAAHCSKLWAVGDGGKLPRTAHDAARLDVKTATISELTKSIEGMGFSTTKPI